MQVQLKNVTALRGEKTVLDGLNATFEDGVNVVVGKNGSGKTTLLNVVAGLVAHDGDCTKVKTAYVFSTARLVEKLTVLQNVALVLKGKVPKQQIEQRAKKYLATAESEDNMNEYPNRLSDGEKQRVALARAFACERDVILLDEPFSSLDYGVKNRLYGAFDGLLAMNTANVIFVTHDSAEAVMLADNVYVLEDGTLRAVGKIKTPRCERDAYSDESIALRKKIEEMTK